MAIEKVTSLSALQDTIRSGKPFIIDFFATWCGPCRAIAPRFEQLASSHKDKVTFYKVDVDEHPDVARYMEVTAMPTFVGFKGGQKLQPVMGANPTALEALIKLLAQ